MQKYYLHLIQRIWPVLLWAGLMSQATRAQSVPDTQWARVGRKLIVTTDGNIVAAELVSSSPTGPGPFIQSGDRLVKYSLEGDALWSTGLLKGGFYIGGKLPGIDFEAIRTITASAATANGGMIVAGPLNVRGGSNVAVSVSADGTFESWGDSQVFNSFGNDDYPRDLVSRPDGGFSVLASKTQLNEPSTTLLIIEAPSQPRIIKQIAYPNPATAGPDHSLTKGNAVINTPDGGYLIVGYVNTNGATSPEVGWVAKLDRDANIIWQKLLSGIPRTGGFNGPTPGEIYAMRTVTDVIVSADGSGYALVGTGLLPGSVGGPPPATSLLEIDLNGDFRRGRGKAIDTRATDAFITLYTDRGGKTYYAVGNSSLQNGVDPQILLVDPGVLPPGDPGVLNVVAKRTFEAPGDGPLTDIAKAGDGSLVFVTANNQVVKLKAETISVPALRLTQPTYDCQTGAIVLNTVGGDGSPITFSAPGISRTSVTSPVGTVEQGLRNDPKLILISATQNGMHDAFYFDLKAACGSIPGALMPVYAPLPDRTHTVGQLVDVQLGSYFSDPTRDISGYYSDWQISAEGLPDGLQLYNRSSPSDVTPDILIGGTPRTPGSYTVTITASTSAFRNYPIRTSFTFFVLSNSQPTDGLLSMTQPTYDCTTGVIMFNTTGGDGSPITFDAPGISRTSATSNSGIVEQGLRNDPKPLTITASQTGQQATYIFDFKAYCTNPQPPAPPAPPTSTALALLAPTYDCQTGAITFRSSGGNGSPVEYASAGITGWTTNPDQFVDRDSRTANDVKPFTLMARQNGVVVAYSWDLKATCGRGISARLGAGEHPSKLRVLVLGNPVSEAMTVEVRGAAGKPLTLRLVDMGGRLVEQRFVEQAGEIERQVFDVGQQRPGVLLLGIDSNTQRWVVKVLKH